MPGVTSLAILSGAQAGGGLLNAYTQSEAIRAEGRWQKAVSEFNAKVAKRRAKEAERIGSERSIQILGEGRRVESAQRAAQAASGIQLDFGSAESVRSQTRVLSALDALEIRKNSYLRALGFESQAIQYTAAGRLAKLSSRVQAGNTLATAINDVLGQGIKTGAAIGELSPSAPPLKSFAPETLPNSGFVPETFPTYGPVYFNS